ncbi:MAG TPA: methyltransferase [Polyangiaceae bacterium]|nr:methyltransferase [Polyangiaceae bacterium]
MAGVPMNSSGSKGHPNATRPATTTDTLYDGAVSLRQPARGYRVNVDALLLAAFAAHGRRADLAVDLGAGVGSVALGLHHLGAATRFALVERETSLLALADENARTAGLQGTCFAHDLALGLPESLRQAAELVVSNPPFFDPDHARLGPDAQKTRARFGDLGPFVAAAAAALSGARSRAAFVYPARELNHFLTCAERVKLIPKRLRLVHADVAAPARVALIELRRARPGGLVILPPLFEWLEKGVRTSEVTRILAGKRL